LFKANDDMKHLNGIIAVSDTPFTSDDHIDQLSLRRYVDNALNAGVVGFLVPAKAAEVDKLTALERELMVDTVLKEVNNRVVVIGGASAEVQEKRIKYTRSLIRLGCDGILVSIPFTGKQQYEKDIMEIADLQPGFLMIQDWDFHGQGIPLEIIVGLFERIECFRYLKVEVVPAGIKYSEVIKATGGKLHVSGGWAGGQMIEALDRGVNAFMPTVLLEVYNRIYQLHRLGERERAKNIFYDLLTSLAFSHQHLDISIHFGKRFYHRMGIFSSTLVRKPILPFDHFHEKIAAEMIEKAIELLNHLDKY
jgi:dihydrodipicolinate synthase/N-acetylneuraminate lyase